MSAEVPDAPVPDDGGHFVAPDGVRYGGRFAPESLMAALDELAEAYDKAGQDPHFQAELRGLLTNYAARPTLLYHAENFSKLAGTTVLLKREDLTHTGSHKINNVLGQRCWHAAWARPGSSRRPAPDSTASPPLPPPP
jgi:tryptophan synthase beta chain